MTGTIGTEWRRCSRGTGSHPGKGLPLPALGLKLPSQLACFGIQSDITRYAQMAHSPDLAGKGCKQHLKGVGFGVLDQIETARLNRSKQ